MATPPGDGRIFFGSIEHDTDRVDRLRQGGQLGGKDKFISLSLAALQI